MIRRTAMIFNVITEGLILSAMLAGILALPVR